METGSKLPDGEVLTEARKYTIQSGYDHYWRFHEDEEEWAKLGCPICQDKRVWRRENISEGGVVTTEKECNDRLATWLGWHYEVKKAAWVTPDGKSYPQAPFTKSFDACLEYIAPKLDVWDLYNYLYKPRVKAAVSIPSVEGVGFAIEDTAPLAFSRAVEQLLPPLPEVQ